MASREQGTAVTDANSSGKRKETTCSCLQWLCPRNDGEKQPLLNNGKNRGKYVGESEGNGEIQSSQDNGNNAVHDSESEGPCPSPSSFEAPEKIEMKPLQIKEVDAIFKKFEETFNLFSSCQDAMMTAVEEFENALERSGEFYECLKEFKRQLSDKVIVMKKLALKFPKSILKSANSVGSAATALTKILEAYCDLEKLPGKVIDKTIICVKEVMGLDPTDIMKEEFSGSVFDLGKIPKQMTNMRENVKQMKKAPGIVTSFFQYSTSIVMQIIDVFGGEKNKEEVKRVQERVNKDTQEKDSQLKELDDPKPPKEMSFTSLKIPSIDRIFDDIAKMINPVAKLSKDLYDSRAQLQDAMKSISEFRDDKTKAFNDYLNELKKRVEKGDVHISVSVRGNRVEVDKVEGLEPDIMKTIQSGLKGVIKSGSEIEDLGPKTVAELIRLINDVSQVSKSDIKSHVSIKEIVPTVSALNENSRKAKEIPGILKFFICFIRNLLMDILDLLHTKESSSQVQGSENENENENENKNAESQYASAEDN